MAQVKIYGQRGHLERVRAGLSEVVHACLCEALGLPPDKRFERFIGLDPAGFIHPRDRSAAYTIVEISMFDLRGRTGDRLALGYRIDV